MDINHHMLYPFPGDFVTLLDRRGLCSVPCGGTALLSKELLPSIGHWRWMLGCSYLLSQTWLVPHTGRSFLLEYTPVFLCGRPWWLQSMTVFLNSVFWLPLLRFLWFLYLLYKSRLWLRFCFCVLSKRYDSFINNKSMFFFLFRRLKFLFKK